MSYSGALEAVDRILNRGGDADDVLRQVVGVFHERAGFAWAGIAFAEQAGLELGPEAGVRKGAEAAFPVAFQADPVGELRVSPPPDEDGRRLCERVALLVSPYCRAGWDTGGEPWEP